MKKIGFYLKKDVVLTISLLLAFMSCWVIHPDKEYIGYIDFDTLILLFCLMMATEGMKEEKFFQFLGGKILDCVKTARGIVLTLIFLCFFSSMFVTNDVALITFVPLGILILRSAEMEKHLCFTIVMMTIAANLGSMLTPVGNPQNLYLYSISEFNMGSFLWFMLPYSIAAAVLLIFLTVFQFWKKRERIHVKLLQEKTGKKNILYLFLFLLCILSVAGVIPKGSLLLITVLLLLFLNRGLFAKADYSLLLTFLGFFIFVGNVNRIQTLNHFIGGILSGNEILVSVGASQMISNVPAAVLLSNYTSNVKALLVGTNLGGLGTLIASMASLISYKQLAEAYPGEKKGYLVLFTEFNFIFLAVLLLFSAVLMQ